ncbi:MAG: tRNA cyclic N6-threonylcarbamoyladenosine(37) synthase TcdA [Gammaproteobacteria bacterium]|nr:tRNA cyclic N6-threonylcarbamoyladenosine(37) synthase TcdA [Gammaproteobacteria bacterium]
MSKQTSRRFIGIQRLYGQQAYQKISTSHICVIGIGGVGSWVVESLARSGIQQLTLIDLDHISESNINRQVHALSETLGQSKVIAMQERVKSINPDCRINLIDDHLSCDNIPLLLNVSFDYIIDCIDQFRVKASLIHYCRSNKINLLTIGGAGGRVDPSRIKVTDLSRSEGDSLLAKTRKQLRTQHNFPRNLQRRFDIACIFSSEQLRYPTDDNEISTSKSECSNISGLNCANGFGSLTAVTATFGMIACAHVLNKITNQQ